MPRSSRTCACKSTSCFLICPPVSSVVTPQASTCAPCPEGGAAKVGGAASSRWSIVAVGDGGGLGEDAHPVIIEADSAIDRAIDKLGRLMKDLSGSLGTHGGVPALV